ncbi:hypothetical protein [Flavobacterium wongokense]|uniref:hypothetical protein n=1 Tax=Flavobacterium wongokense TaxID=2910674 RepID=UPI001F46088B|nr:hypothetical protein [Flavobacterium sp. WG47]MCF6133459.1 hypothetical protein [Flavobacterium sp. WG47]
MKENILAFYKKILSYRKTNWELEDYPLRYRNQSNSEDKEIKTWVLQIVNWWTLTGLGDTKAEAYDMLKEHFENYKHLNNELPRPGTSVPIKFADTEEIDNLENIAVDFFDKILGYNYYECFISDESSLIDFGQDNEETLQKINEIYSLNLKEIGDGNIVRILTLINEKGSL